MFFSGDCGLPWTQNRRNDEGPWLKEEAPSILGPIVCWVGSLPSPPFFPQSWGHLDPTYRLQALGSADPELGEESKIPGLQLKGLVSFGQIGPNSRD